MNRTTISAAIAALALTIGVYAILGVADDSVDRPQPQPKPYRYAVSFRFHQKLAGELFEVGTTSLLIVGDDIPASFQLKTGRHDLSGKCTVSRENNVAMAKVDLEVVHDGQKSEPELIATVGRTASCHLGGSPTNELQVEVTVVHR